MRLPLSIRLFWRKNDFLIVCAFIVLGLTVYHRLDNINFTAFPRLIPCDGTPYFNKDDRFTGIVNTRVDVPNIVHYVRFGLDAQCFTQDQVNSLLSVVENHQPSRIYIHTDNVSSVEELVSRVLPRPVKLIVEVRFYPQPKHAFGLNFSESHRITHAVDFTKLKLLRRYGGIYLHNNVYVLRNLRKFLNFEMTIVVQPRPEHEIPIEIVDDVVFAHRDARFLSAWLKTYHEYNKLQPKHSNANVVKSMLKKNSKYTHIFEYNLRDDIEANSEELKAAAKSKKHFFVILKNNKDQCVS